MSAEAPGRAARNPKGLDNTAQGSEPWGYVRVPSRRTLKGSYKVGPMPGVSARCRPAAVLRRRPGPQRQCIRQHRGDSALAGACLVQPLQGWGGWVVPRPPGRGILGCVVRPLRGQGRAMAPVPLSLGRCPEIRTGVPALLEISVQRSRLGTPRDGRTDAPAPGLTASGPDPPTAHPGIPSIWPRAGLVPSVSNRDSSGHEEVWRARGAWGVWEVWEV